MWLELEGADQYRLQIVSPKFDSILTPVLDSVIKSNFFSTNLIPGDYQWRVRGENTDFQTDWFTGSLTITSTESLNSQIISGISPINGTNVDSMMLTFAWNELVSADYYSIIIEDEDDNEIEINNSEEATYTYNFPGEGIFTVNIKALNDISASITSSVSIRIDSTAPAEVALDFPLYDTLRSFPQDFEWDELATNTGSAISNNLIIASDSLMTSKLLDFTFSSVTTIALDSVETSGKLYWRIDRTDAAGNSTQGVSKGFWIE